MPNVDQMKGRVKEAAGDLTDNDDLEREGKVDKTAGKAKDMAHDAKEKLDSAVDSLKDKLHKD